MDTAQAAMEQALAAEGGDGGDAEPVSVGAETSHPADVIFDDVSTAATVPDACFWTNVWSIRCRHQCSLALTRSVAGNRDRGEGQCEHTVRRADDAGDGGRSARGRRCCG